MADIYRKSALERISSPEQLDKAIVVASPMSWLALGAATVIVLILIVWGFFTGELSDTVTAPGILHSPTGVNTIYAREPGTITDIPAYEGMVLTPDQVVARYRVTGMGELKEILAGQIGTVTRIEAKVGDQVKWGQDIVHFTPGLMPGYGDRPVVVCYVKQSDAEKLVVGSENHKVTLTSDKSQTYGRMTARILCIDAFPATELAMSSVVGTGNNQAAAFQSDNSPVVAVTLDLKIGNTPNGFDWGGNARGENITIRENDRVSVQFVVETMKPYQKMFKSFKDKWEGRK